MGQAHTQKLFERRAKRTRYNIRKKLGDRMRLTVFRSSNHIYAQIVDDREGKTLVSASTVDKELKDKVKNGGNIEAAKAVGELVAKKAKAAKITRVAYDRGGYLYHGRVKALADAARENGLDF